MTLCRVDIRGTRQKGHGDRDQSLKIYLFKATKGPELALVVGAWITSYDDTSDSPTCASGVIAEEQLNHQFDGKVLSQFH